MPAESQLWGVLRNRGLAGFKFRRQHPIERFVTDFAWVECKIVLEVDGETNLRDRERDQERT